MYEFLLHTLKTRGPMAFRITPSEMFLLEEAVIHPSGRSEDSEGPPGKEEALPFLYDRDETRGIAFRPDVMPSDYDAPFDAMLAAGLGPQTCDDLVTLMRQANTRQIRIEAVPLSQTIYLSSRRSTLGGSGFHQGQACAWSPSGSEIRADLGQFAGAAQGLHQDTFDDWPLRRQYAEVPQAFAALTKGVQFSRTMLTAEWASEKAVDWTNDAPALLRRLCEMDPSR